MVRLRSAENADAEEEVGVLVDNDVPGGACRPSRVAPPSAAANALALAGSRPMISTVLPPASARPARRWPAPGADDADAAHEVSRLVDDQKG